MEQQRDVAGDFGLDHRELRDAQLFESRATPTKMPSKVAKMTLSPANSNVFSRPTVKAPPWVEPLEGENGISF